MKQGQIQSLQSNGSFEGQYGKLYGWEITLRDSDGTMVHGLVNTKTEQAPYGAGDTVWYELNGQTKRGDIRLKVTKNNPQQQGGGRSYSAPSGNDDRQKSIVTQFAIREALVFLQWTSGVQPDRVQPRDVALYAKQFYAMVQDLDKFIELSKQPDFDPNDLPF